MPDEDEGIRGCQRSRGTEVLLGANGETRGVPESAMSQEERKAVIIVALGINRCHCGAKLL